MVTYRPKIVIDVNNLELLEDFKKQLSPYHCFDSLESYPIGTIIHNFNYKTKEGCFNPSVWLLEKGITENLKHSYITGSRLILTEDVNKNYDTKKEIKIINVDINTNLTDLLIKEAKEYISKKGEIK